jgi:hypothetical protein
MYYIVKLPSGVAKISVAKPKDGTDYFTVDELPEGDGAIMVGSNNQLYLQPQGIPDSEPTDSERIATLEAENANLKAQTALQSEQLTFLEDCILEMGDVVYS